MIKKFFRRTYPVLNIYTDGACWNNGREGAKASYAFHCVETGYEEAGDGGYMGKHTNNTGELNAIVHALNYAQGKTRFVKIHTDSKYAGNSIFCWPLKAGKKNYDLIHIGKSKVRFFDIAKFVFVRGHSGDEVNERVDGLARTWLLNNSGDAIKQAESILGEYEDHGLFVADQSENNAPYF